VPAAILACDQRLGLDLASFAGLEAQAASIADDIAYDAHDIDDGLRAELFDLLALRRISWVGQLLDEIDALHPGLERPRVVHELGRRIITGFIEDAIAESRRRIAEASVRTIDDVRAAGRPLVGLSPALAAADAEIKGFLFANMYRQADVTRVRAMADQVVRRLFAAFMADPAAMPREWAEGAGALEADRARSAADYIAGMTDRFAIAEHRRIFDEAPELR
jgi:dGTPase